MPRRPHLAHRALIGAIFLAFLTAAIPPAEAGLLGRLADARRALTTERDAIRGWIVFEAVAWTGRDLRAVGISVLTGDPTTPAFYVHFQETDSRDVGRKLRAGHMITIRKYRMDTSGPIPVYFVKPYSNNGWRARGIKKASRFFATWGYLISARILSRDPANFDNFFRHRPDLFALLKRDVGLVNDTVTSSALGEQP